MAPNEEEDPRALKQRIRELEEENQSLRRLIEVIKSLPSVRGELEERTRKEKAKPTEAPRARKSAVQRRSEAGGGNRAEGEGPAPAR